MARAQLSFENSVNRSDPKKYQKTSLVLTTLHAPLAMAALAPGRAAITNWMSLIVEIGSRDGSLEAIDCGVLMIELDGHAEGIYVV